MGQTQTQQLLDKQKYFQQICANEANRLSKQLTFGVARFFFVKHTKIDKIYHPNLKYTK
jgi:glycyl-tRNA synthetase alpha subunit